MDNIKFRIKELRESEKLSQKSFGDKINLSQSQVASYESGHRNLTERTINDICRVFNVNQNWLLKNEGDMYISQKDDEILADALAKISLSNNKQLYKVISQLTKLDEKYIDLVNNLLDAIICENKKDK
ncbi:helix-turn-helix domain-containing protein [Clostridium ihumii]|uniref:helix-turn-helix domain-containing protein n=1 Tax=Clostridium ihumii TaxID=1470356 RepID=UPI00058EC537|nr:helix-turn-helix transcriptional regulator [Clostridium ihumii]